MTDLADIRSVADIPRVQARQRPDEVAFWFEGRETTFAQLEAASNQVANALLAQGLQPGDRVGVLAKNIDDFFPLWLGCVKARVTLAPVNWRLAPPEVAFILRDAGAKLLFVGEDFGGVVDMIMSDLPDIHGLIQFEPGHPRWPDFRSWIAAHPATDPMLPVDMQDDVIQLYTSGTTGLPKGILHSHALRSQLPVRFPAFDYGPDTVSIVSTPLYSNTTLVALLATVGVGGTSVLMRKSDVVKFLELSQAERATHAMLVPVQYQRILAHPDFDKYDLGSFKAKLSTSAPLRAHIKADAVKRWPGRLIEIYGLTEGGGSCMLEANLHPTKLHTVGLPGFGVELRILDEQGGELPQGEVGEIAGRAEMMMKGYYKQDDKTRELFWHDKDGRLFFKSGDMGKIDEDGFLILLDRKKDMIISGGFNVYAADIEVLLLKHPDVIDVAVIGVPSDQWGESPMALCVRREGAAVSEDEVREWANDQLSKTQRLVAVEFRDSLPRSTIGKIMKRELRAPYWEGRAAKI